MGIEEADDFHPPTEHAARSPLWRNPTLADLKADQRGLSDEDADEHAVGDRWMTDLKGGADAATRSVVLHEPGFYVLRLASMPGALKSDHEPSEGTTGDRKSLEEVTQSLSAKKHKKHGSKREKFRQKMASLRTITKGNSRKVEIDVRVRDVHHLSVLVLNSCMESEPTLQQYSSLLHEQDARVRSSSADQAYDQRKRSGSGSGSIDAGPKKAPCNDLSKLVLRYEHGHVTSGSSSFYLDPSNVPAILELSMKANHSHILVGELFVSFKGSVLSSAAARQRQRQRASSLEGAAATTLSYASMRKRFLEDSGEGSVDQILGSVLSSPQSSDNAGATRSLAAMPSTPPRQRGAPKTILDELSQESNRPQSARGRASSRFSLGNEPTGAGFVNSNLIGDVSDTHSEGGTENTSRDLSERVRRTLEPLPGEVQIENVAASEDEDSTVQDRATSNRHRRAMSLFARYSDMSSSHTINNSSENDEEDDEEENPDHVRETSSDGGKPTNRPIHQLAYHRTISQDGGDSDVPEDAEEYNKEIDESGGNSSPGSKEILGIPSSESTIIADASPTEHVHYASKRSIQQRKPRFRDKLLQLESAHLNAMTTSEMSPAGLPPAPFERIWGEMKDMVNNCDDIGQAIRALNKRVRADLPMKLKPLVTQGRWFYEFNGTGEPLGRAVLLRGVNLSGNVKLPYKPNGSTQLRFDWGKLKDPAIAAELSFVGRPFPLDEAHEHFSRLRRWGFNCFRFLVTWEAIEHAGPGDYDSDYLDYVELMVRIAGSYGFYVFIDPHQDVWSRMTGGSGAPAWTLTAAGLDLAKLEASEAAFTHNCAPDAARFQRMSWPQNYQRFAAAHMFTLFWGGNDFAPDFAVESGIPIQEYLQRHFIDAMLQIVYRVKDMPHVLGFDSFNEPSPGFIGRRLDDLPDVIIPPGPVFRPIDAMVTAAGHSCSVGRANSIGLITGRYKANPTRTSAWREGVADVWQRNGLYDIQEVTNEQGQKVEVARILRPEHFCYFPSQDKHISASVQKAKVEFFRDYLRPFMVLYISRIRALMPRAILFAEGDGFGEKEFIWDHADPRGVVNASHWYDGYTLFTANFNPRFSVDVSTKMPVFGAHRIYNMHMRDLRAISELPRALDGAPVEMPTLIGEFGLPFNMNNKFGFKTGDFKMHERAMSMYYDVMDALQLHSTQWNYCGDNCNDWGDNWNLEDLSLFSRDQQKESAQKDINSGGRGIEGFSRPFAPFCCGRPILTDFQRKTRSFEHSYEPNPRNFDYGNLEHATEIYIPDIQYIAKQTSSVVQFDIIVEGGKFKKRQLPGRHILYVWADQSAMEATNHVNCVTVRILFPLMVK